MQFFNKRMTTDCAKNSFLCVEKKIIQPATPKKWLPFVEDPELWGGLSAILKGLFMLYNTTASIAFHRRFSKNTVTAAVIWLAFSVGVRFWFTYLFLHAFLGDCWQLKCNLAAISLKTNIPCSTNCALAVPVHKRHLVSRDCPCQLSLIGK